MPNEELLAAVNAAIEVAPEPKAKTVAEDPLEEEGVETPDGDEAGEGDEADGDEAGDEAGEGDEADGDEAGEGDEPELGADGKPVAKTKTPEEIAAKEAAKEAKAAEEAARPKDPLNDPVDPRLKETTRERITTLIEIAKNVTAERDTLKQNYGEVMGYIQQSQATPEQYGQALDYIGMVNSGDPVKMNKAWEFMTGEMQALGRMLGKEVPGLDYLANHADLKQAVATKQMSEQAARELAVHRDTAAHRTQMQTQQAQTRQTQEQQNQVIAQGRNELNELGRQLAGTDPNYARKAPLLTAALKGAFRDIDPRQWAARYKQAYDALVLPVAPIAAAKAKSNVPVNQPLRGKQPAGGAVQAPKNAREAIENALAGM